MLVRSANATVPSRAFTAPVCFSTPRDSPVRELSLTVSPYTSSSRPSAATISPVSSSRISPGTTRADGMVMLRPSRRTLASGEESRFKLSRDFSAFWCWTVPSTAFNSRTANMTMALSGSPVSMDTAAAPIRIMTKRSLNCARNTCHHWSRPASSNTFSPYSLRRCSACPLSIPCLPESSPANTSASGCSNQSAICLSPLTEFMVLMSLRYCASASPVSAGRRVNRYKNAPGSACIRCFREHSIRVPTLNL